MIRELTDSLRTAARRAHVRGLRWVLAGAAVPFALWACGSHPLQQPQPAPVTQTNNYFEVNPNRNVDIVFMVDNSNSMKEEQENLTRNFPAFIKKLEGIPGGLPDVRIAVVTSDVGAGGSQKCAIVDGVNRNNGGRFQSTEVPGGASCGLQNDATWIVAQNGGKTTNLDPGKTLPDVFTCMAKRGVTGCGFEHQLQAVRLALYPQAGLNDKQNKDFLRKDAYLAIILITDEDDCSANEKDAAFFNPDYMGQTDSLRCATDGHVCNNKPVSATMDLEVPLKDCAPSNPPAHLIKVQEIVDNIKALKTDPNKLIVAGIVGWPLDGNTATAKYHVGQRQINGGGKEWDLLPVCEYKGGTAMPGLRLNQFVSSFNDPGKGIYSICQEDLTPALEKIGDLVALRVGNQCVSLPLVDVDPKTPGLQEDCVVSDSRPGANGQTMDVAIPKCAGASPKTPCWNLVKEDSCTASSYKVDVNRGNQMAPANTQVSVKCQACPREGDPKCPKS